MTCSKVEGMQRLFRGGRALCVVMALLCMTGPEVQGQGAPRFAEETLALRQAAHASAPATLQRPAAAHYDVVALRVAFRPDTTRFTTGDGTFDGALYPEGLTPTMDPLPHDAAYFEAHLAFLEDYVARVSDGQTTVTTHLVPEVVQVAQEMGAYSPTGPDSDSDEELAKLARLVEEAWTRADAETTFDLSGFDPATTVFVLFHAGVGRDIELIGTTLDKTPEDLPSLFFDEAALRRLLGPVSITFKGMPVTRTLILPRTETRSGFDFIRDEPFLAEFSINGLLASSVFNALGVPDLFNTETGESAIGPFGLMDPLGIFAFNGLFPPEPSAWTKRYLGWTGAEDLQGDGPETVALRHTSDPVRSDVARAWISGGEYFLVENRHRDPEGDGLVMRVWRDGAVREVRVPNGDDTFNRLDTRGFEGGVVVGVDDYDFAVPGGVDEDGNDLNGGILVWHIDERRLAEGMPANRVNADPDRRAVDVEEADGAQDIGFPNPGSFGPAFDLGTPFDFFFRDNPVVVVTQTGAEVRLYENRFASDTFPDSRSNEGGPSFITLENFSEPGVEMAFTYRRDAAAGLRPLLTGVSLDEVAPGLRFPEGSLVKGFRFEDVEGFSGVMQWLLYTPDDGGWLLPFRVDEAGGVTAEEPIRAYSPPVVLPGNAYGFVGSGEEGGLAYVEYRWAADGTLVTRVESLPAPVEASTLPPPVAVGANGAVVYVLLPGAEGGALVRIPPAGPVQLREITGIGRIASMASDGAEGVLVVGEAGVVDATGAIRWRYHTGGATPGTAAFGRDVTGLLGVMLLRDGLLWLMPDGQTRVTSLASYAPEAGEPLFRPGQAVAFADVEGDRRLEAVVVAGRRVLALTRGGALATGFPLPLPAEVVAEPLVGTRGGEPVVVAAATDGYLYALPIGARGRPAEGFPLSVGLTVAATPYWNDQLAAVTEEGTLSVWISDEPAGGWHQAGADDRNSRFVALPVGPPEVAPEGLLVDGETYNWPNPIRDGVTHLRYLPSKPCRIRITIIDAAGALIDEIAVDGVPAGVSSEYTWTTDAPSGLYFARITAVADDGETQSRLVKMAIIR